MSLLSLLLARPDLDPEILLSAVGAPPVEELPVVPQVSRLGLGSPRPFIRVPRQVAKQVLRHRGAGGVPDFRC
jgi:hypothetical protein